MRKRVVRYLFCKTFDILIKERYNKKQAIDFYNRLQCGYGGTGRRAGLRSRCLRRGGSNPFIRTNKTGSTISAARFVLYRIHKGIWWGRKSTRVLLFAYGSWKNLKSFIANQTVRWTVCRGGAQSAKSLYPHQKKKALWGFFFWCYVKLKRDLNGQVAATEKLIGMEKLRLNGGHPPFTAPAW